MTWMRNFRRILNPYASTPASAAVSDESGGLVEWNPGMWKPLARTKCGCIFNRLDRTISPKTGSLL
jgi:hypothetical protein